MCRLKKQVEAVNFDLFFNHPKNILFAILTKIFLELGKKTPLHKKIPNQTNKLYSKQNLTSTESTIWRLLHHPFFLLIHTQYFVKSKIVSRVFYI